MTTIQRISHKIARIALALALALISVAQARADVTVLTYSTAASGGISASSNQNITGAWSFLDAANFKLKNTADPTKIIQLDLSGITTGNTRTITPPDSNTTLPIATQVLTWTGPTAARTITLPDLNISLPSATQIITWAGPTAARTYTLRDANDTIASLGATNAFTGTNSFLDGSFSIKNTADTTKVIQFSASGLTTGNTVTPFTLSGTAAAPLVLFASGSAGAPSVAFAAATTTGFHFEGTSFLVDTAAARRMAVNSAQLGIQGTMLLGFAAGSDPTAAIDTIIGRAAAATPQLGSNINGAPTDQTIKAHNGITGTDIAGAALIVESGIGTGAAVSHPYTVNRQIVKATGTTAQTYAPAMVVCPTKILSNTSATAQTVATITTTSTTAGAINWFYTVTASNGTVLDSDTAEILIAWNNNAGTVTSAAGTGVGGVSSAASGTLASTPTRTDATNVVSLKLTPTWTVIVPTTVTGYSTFLVNNSGDAVVCQ